MTVADEPEAMSAEQLKVPALHVLIGAPGAGKSTWTAAQSAGLGAVLSLDDARAEISGDAGDQSVTRHAVKLVTDRAMGELLARRVATIDATGAVASDRQHWLTLAQSWGGVPTAWVFRTPLEVCLARNARRSPNRRVPDDVVIRMWTAIDSVSVEELHQDGFRVVVELLHPDLHPRSSFHLG
ncbi:AAA family ATPase [Lentzea chajnantorensis]